MAYAIYQTLATCWSIDDRRAYVLSIDLCICEQVTGNIEPDGIRIIHTGQQLDEVSLESDVSGVSSSRHENDRRLRTIGKT